MHFDISLFFFYIHVSEKVYHMSSRCSLRVGFIITVHKQEEILLKIY